MMALGEFMCTGNGQVLCAVMFIAGIVALIALEIFDAKWGE